MNKVTSSSLIYCCFLYAFYEVEGSSPSKTEYGLMKEYTSMGIFNVCPDNNSPLNIEANKTRIENRKWETETIHYNFGRIDLTYHELFLFPIFDFQFSFC